MLDQAMYSDVPRLVDEHDARRIARDTRHNRYVERAPDVRLAVDAGQHVATDAFASMTSLPLTAATIYSPILE